MENSLIVIWLATGVVLFFSEMLMPGIGLMFAGCGALTVGLLLNFAFIPVDNILLQALVFLVSTALWAVILWKPIQKMRVGRSRDSYQNIVGEIAIVTEQGLSKIHGEVKWSGTLMKAKLPEDSPISNLQAGAVVVIQDISGNVLTVIPK